MKQKEGELVQRYELGRLLGQGTFAKVYFARNRRSGQSVAIKVIDKEKVLKAGMMDQIKREISVMRSAHHPNIVELYEVMASKKKIYFVMEYAKGGELFAKVAKGKIEEDDTRRYFQQLISAIDYCHNRGVFHRDLKPENLLLDENGNLKVTDFGLSALAECKRHDGFLHTICGTPAYVAPDVISRKGYDGSKADIWSCGVILYVLLAGYLPFRDSNVIELYKKISKGEFKFPNWFAPDVQSLLSKILDPNPSRRISISEIMESSWFQKGLSTNCVYTEIKGEEPAPLDFSGVSGLHRNGSSTIELDQEVTKPCNLNAFDIISYSAGLDLYGLFEETHHKEELWFTSNKPASIIISKLEDVAKHLGLKFQKKERGLLKLEGSTESRKGVLAIDAEIFEIIPFFHVVEIRNSKGDTVEYQNIMKQVIKPALKDIIWSWQGEKPQHLQEQLNQQDLQL